MKIRYAQNTDLNVIMELDKHISLGELNTLIKLKRVYVFEVNSSFAGWSRYGLFWDNTPFLNMLYFLEEWRGKGFGKLFMEHWEKDMKLLGFGTVMTSTQSNEYAQHFYDKLGYKAIGGFVQQDESYELLFIKEL